KVLSERSSLQVIIYFSRNLMVLITQSVAQRLKSAPAPSNSVNSRFVISLRHPVTGTATGLLAAGTSAERARAGGLAPGTLSLSVTQTISALPAASPVGTEFGPLQSQNAFGKGKYYGNPTQAAANRWSAGWRSHGVWPGRAGESGG